jgi:hypothetical protein
MSQNDRRRAILEAAGAEAAQRRPAEVIDLPLRSAFLTRSKTAKPEAEPAQPVPHPGWIRHLPKVGEYLGIACLALVGVMIFSGVRQTLILADVGRSTCSTLRIADDPEAQVFWTEDDAASTVPRLRTAQFVSCMRAGKPF